MRFSAKKRRRRAAEIVKLFRPRAARARRGGPDPRTRSGPRATGPLDVACPSTFPNRAPATACDGNFPSSSSTPSSAAGLALRRGGGARVSNEAAEILKRVAACVNAAVASKGVQSQPHVVLLDKAWYKAERTPLLAEWAELWLRAHGAARGVAEHHMRAYLTRTEGAAEAAQVIEREAEDESLKMINLARDWLTALLPHVLAKINRVSYGLLSAKDVQALEQANGGARVPTSRRLLAVPFVAEGHPLADERVQPPGRRHRAHHLPPSRHEGLRRGDFRQVSRSLLAELEQETGPQGKRKSASDGRLLVRRAAGPCARRGARGSRRRRETHGRVAQGGHHGRHARAALRWQRTGSRAGASPSTTRCDRCSSSTCATSTRWRRSIELLRLTPEVIEYYLDWYVFPKTARHQGMKLSASTGQELGGDLLFPRRLGFSGTPADLLPLELGAPKFARGTDAKVLATLADESVVSAREMGADWDVRALAASRPRTPTPVHALVDVGALVTAACRTSQSLGFCSTRVYRGRRGASTSTTSDCQMVLMRKGWTAASIPAATRRTALPASSSS